MSFVSCVSRGINHVLVLPPRIGYIYIDIYASLINRTCTPDELYYIFYEKEYRICAYIGRILLMITSKNKFSTDE